MPKPPSFSSDDEDEKTTIESGGWEEEASTTVEQGDVAEKLRTLGLGLEQARRPNTNITSTNGGGVSDELTADDQRGAAALARLPPSIVARLVITQGNDAGQAIEVRPGKTYTIGRGVDNDLVLTDIAVSRKHFDIRAENGAWVLSDRGSGNGTLVNNRIEDAPFMLASGDIIEIGNTSFRFDLPNGAPRAQPAFDASVDDDLELSTISSKPMRAVDADGEAPTMPAGAAMAMPPARPMAAPGMLPGMPPGMPMAGAAMPIPHTPPALPSAPIPPPGPTELLPRPKTLPPPSPMPRPRTQSHRVSAAHAVERQRPPTQPPPLPTALGASSPAMPQMQPSMGSQPLPIQGQAGMPIQLQPLPQATLPQMVNRGLLPPAALVDAPLTAQPTTIPGQGPPLPSTHLGHPAHPARLPFSYPSASHMNGQMNGGMNGQMNGGMNGQMNSGRQPRITQSRNAMLVASGQPTRDATSTALVQPISYPNNGQAVAAPSQTFARPGQLSRRVKMALGGLGLALFAALSTIAIIKATSSSDTTVDITEPPPKPPAHPTVEPIHDPGPPKPPATTKAGKPRSTITPISPQAGSNAATQPALAPGKTSGPGIATAPPTTAPPPTTPPPTTAPPSAAPPVTPPRLAATTPPPVTTTAPPATTAAPPATTTPPPVVPPVAPRVEPPPAREITARIEETTVRIPPRKTEPPKKTDSPKKTEKHPAIVARVEPEHVSETPRHGGKSMQEVKNEANGLYRQKNFSGAAALIQAALPGFSAGDAAELKSIGSIYSQLGKAYSVGMAPGTKPTDAYAALKRALNLDRDVGSAYASELEEHQVNAATRAASSYMAAKEYESAFEAVRASESLGSTSSNNKVIRGMLEGTANDLLRDAQSALASDPDGAKKKLHQVLGIVDPKSPLHAKAQKLLSGGS
ncbi:MAG TPA: FHA domain-containing protein [Kofleriaceae bacterium]|nr:FHA domain-containing protein [Kofleriaceae bacterium]